MLDIQRLVSGDRDEQLYVIKKMTEERLCVLLGGMAKVPSELEYIVTEVTLARGNRIGSEGTSSHSVEGESISWSSDSDFDPYMNDIEAYQMSNESKYGRVRFI